jgi:hypothetical protein
MWYGETHYGGGGLAQPKYRCAICVADAKIKLENLKRRRAVSSLFSAVT